MTGGNDDVDDRDALRKAFFGVTPLKGKPSVDRLGEKPAKPTEPAVQTRSIGMPRAGGEIDFHVEYPDAYSVVGYRKGVHKSHVDALRDPELHDEESLDLHGLRADAARKNVVKYVRKRHSDGYQYGLVIHGKGTRSPGGKGVLRGVVIDAITSGEAAHFVLAFATAPRRLGGEGALAIKFVR